MENNLAFSGNAEVIIQGERVLRFVNYFEDRAIYDVIGFDAPHITLIDYRKSGLLAIQTLLAGGELSAFAHTFNVPAHISIWVADDGNLSIELGDAEDQPISHVLWIAIGMGEDVPVYDYLFEYAVPFEDTRYAFVALYKSSSIDKASAWASSSSSGSAPWAG